MDVSLHKQITVNIAGYAFAPEYFNFSKSSHQQLSVTPFYRCSESCSITSNFGWKCVNICFRCQNSFCYYTSED